MKKILATVMIGTLMAGAVLPVAAEDKTEIEMWTLFTGVMMV